MTAVADLQRVEVAATRRLCSVPEWLTVTQWADRYRILPESSTSPGPYRSDVLPFHRRPQDCLGDPAISMVVLCWGSQLGKSTVLENAIGYRIHQMPSPIMLVRPKIDDAEQWAKERFVPMVQATPPLAERVRIDPRQGATLRYKPFPGGYLFVASAQSATELASRSSANLFLDEVDRFEHLAGEGNPVGIALRRQGAADIGCAGLTSTPRDAETTIIWAYLEGGSFELYHVPCPVCDHMQPLVFGGPNEPRGLKWTRGQPKTAMYLCEQCACLIEEREKPGMLAAGDWVAQHPEHPYPSFHLPSFYSPFAKTSWAVIADEFEKAKGKPADLQVVVNTFFAECWEENKVEQLDKSALRERADQETALQEGVVPTGVGLLTVGGDVQHNRVEVDLWGWGHGLESWLVASFILLGDPAVPPDVTSSVWRRVDDLLFRTYPHANGAQIPVSVSFLDSSYLAPAVYRYTDSRRGRNVFASKGQGGPGVPLIGKPSLQGRERIPLYIIGTDGAKNEFLRSQIYEQTPGPGYVHLPHWLSDDQLEQFVAEKRVPRIHRGRAVYEWRKKRNDMPNERLDCRIYARAALETLGTATIAKLGELADQWAAAAAGQTPAAFAPRRRRVRSRGIDE